MLTNKNSNEKTEPTNKNEPTDDLESTTKNELTEEGNVEGVEKPNTFVDASMKALHERNEKLATEVKALQESLKEAATRQTIFENIDPDQMKELEKKVKEQEEARLNDIKLLRNELAKAKANGDKLAEENGILKTSAEKQKIEAELGLAYYKLGGKPDYKEVIINDAAKVVRVMDGKLYVCEGGTEIPRLNSNNQLPMSVEELLTEYASNKDNELYASAFDQAAANGSSLKGNFSSSSPYRNEDILELSGMQLLKMAME